MTNIERLKVKKTLIKQNKFNIFFRHVSVLLIFVVFLLLYLLFVVVHRLNVDTIVWPMEYQQVHELEHIKANNKKNKKKNISETKYNNNKANINHNC
jgi:hypothetical protein